MAAPYVPVRLRVALPCAPPLAGAFLWDASAPVAHLKRFCIGWARDHLVHAALASAGSSGKKRQQALREVKNADVNVLATAIESAMLPQLIGHLAVATEAAPKATSHAELLDANQADELLVLDVPIGNGMVYRDRVVWRANAHSLLGTADTDITRFARTASKDLDLPAGATQAIACSLREQVDAVRRQRLSRLLRGERDERKVVAVPTPDLRTGDARPRVPRKASDGKSKGGQGGVARTAAELEAFSPVVFKEKKEKKKKRKTTADNADATEGAAKPPPPLPAPPAPPAPPPPPPPAWRR